MGIEGISIHDNFFELGGDSLIGLQFIAKANQAGLRFTNREIFEHQTIAELAAIAEPSRIHRSDEGPVSGLVPLTPIQHWFFEEAIPDAHHWNLAFLLEAGKAVSPLLLETAVQQLLAHHDALRLRFVQHDSGWQQKHAGLNETLPFSHVDLSTLPVEQQMAALQAVATRMQSSLDLSAGPLLRVVLFDCGPEAPSRLLILCHHLVVDVASWRILLEDLCTSCHQLSRGEQVSLPAKTHSFKQWAERLTELAGSEAVERELDYWLATSSVQALGMPVDYAKGPNTIESARTVSVALNAEETQTLLQAVRKSFNAQVNDVLLAALGQAFARWTGASTFLIDLESDGREVAIEGIDVARTVGWFTNLYPTLLDLDRISSPWEGLKSVKDQLRRIPNHGVGHGLLRYMARDPVIAERMRAVPRPEVIFLYLGQFDQSFSLSPLFRLAKEPCGPLRGLRGIRRHLFEITGSVARDEGTLQIQWTFSENIHRRSTIERLAQEVLGSIRSLVARAESQQIASYTPSDFPGARLSQRDLDRFIGTITQSSSKRPK